MCSTAASAAAECHCAWGGHLPAGPWDDHITWAAKLGCSRADATVAAMPAWLFSNAVQDVVEHGDLRSYGFALYSIEALMA
eukprot:scaffold44376_cov20-Tisochrysis_lutea.AAC.1